MFVTETPVPLIQPHNLALLRNRFPEVDQGSEDARTGVWREVADDYESMAYEIGRMLALEPPNTTSLGLLIMNAFLERAFKQLVRC
jgi:hypothetical protein